MTNRTCFKSGVLVAILGALSGCAGSQPAGSSPAEPAPASRKEQVVALLDSIQSGDPGPVAIINPDKLIQHNLSEADGLAGFGAVLAQLPKGSARVHNVRVFEDGDFVFTHTDYDFFGPKIGFDVFRFENGKIVEHWDNLQVTPSAPNASGRSMIDGPTEATQPEETEANKHVVEAFLNDVLVEGHGDKLADYAEADFQQHNPLEADGISGLTKALASGALAIKFDKVHRVLGEGSFVLACSEGTFNGAHSAFYDLFRMHQGQVAEHWDTIETIPPQAEWKNQNGKF
jgi:predicted SnoaL-like aldol condensation-catalyzing enzyme